MTDDETHHESPSGKGSSPRKLFVLLFRTTLWLVFILLLLIIVTAVLPPVVFEVPLRLVGGWAFHLRHTLPDVRWSVEMVVSALIAVLLASISLDAVARRLCIIEDTKQASWSWRASAGVTLGVAVLFGSAICGTGIVHQVGWLMRTEWTTNGFGDYGLSNHNANKARQLVMLVKMYASQAGGVLPEQLEDMQSFMEPGEDLKSLLIPVAKAGEISEPWIYLGSNLPSNAPYWVPVLVQPRSTLKNQTKRIVFTLDAVGNLMSEEEYQALLSRWRGYLQEKNVRR